MTIKPNTWYKRDFRGKDGYYSFTYTTDTHAYIHCSVKSKREYFPDSINCWGTLAEFEGVIAEKGYDIIEIKYADVLLDEI